MPEVKKWAMDVRMSFEKTGMAKFISHLDTVRCITRAMKRANVPIWFTEGFNPHAFLTFAMPLSLGFESLCETVDFRLMEEVDLNELAKKINDALPVDITVKEIYVYETSPNDIRWAEYKIIFNNPDSLLLDKAHSVLSADEIIVFKKAKQGRKKVDKEVNIKEHIKSFELNEEDGKLILQTVLSSGTSININPMLLIGALVKDTATDEQDVDIIKVQSYTEDMKVFR
ncbi:MAG: TIGR03936 family radical SAM-associated protein [Clostridia bacterium]|nr:TIGR03936 family radical SAM-associated protein [Clostridia bacterium]